MYRVILSKAFKLAEPGHKERATYIDFGMSERARLWDHMVKVYHHSLRFFFFSGFYCTIYNTVPLPPETKSYQSKVQPPLNFASYYHTLLAPTYLGPPPASVVGGHRWPRQDSRTRALLRIHLPQIIYVLYKLHVHITHQEI